MPFLHTTSLSTNQKAAISKLWGKVFPSGLNFSDNWSFDQFLEPLQDVHFTLVYNDVNMEACFIAFIRNDLRFFSILIDDAAQGKGLGATLLHRAKQRYHELNGWVVDNTDYLRPDGQPYRSPIAFYEKNGFSVIHEDRWDNEKLNSVKVRWRK